MVNDYVVEILLGFELIELEKMLRYNQVAKYNRCVELSQIYIPRQLFLIHLTTLKSACS